MSEEKTKCEKCGKDNVSANVEAYSKEHFDGHVYCYDCQQSLSTAANPEEETKKGTLEGYVSGDDDDLKTFDEELGEEKAADVEVAGEEGLKDQKQKRGKTVEIDEGMFSFREEGAKLLCKNGASNNEYDLDPKKPYCPCNDFVVNKKGKEWCKHLKAASIAGYKVTKLAGIPEEVSKALAKSEKGKGKPPKAKKEETVAIKVLNTEIEIPIQTPSNMITSENNAIEVIKGIIGNTPKKDDVIESYAGIEELNADVVLSLCSYLGIQYRIVEKEIEKARMSVGKIYELTATEDQMRKYGAVAKIMPEVDIVTRCKVTVAAAWKDKSGNTRMSVGVKEEILTPFELCDIAKRGVNFIETKAITKASKKALLSVLPVTHDGMKSKIKEVYNWK